MRRISPLAVVTAAAASFVASAVYYLVLGNVWLELRGIDPATADLTPKAWEVVGQLGRNLVVAFVLAHLVSRLRIVDSKGAVGLGLWLWLGFQAMQIAGAVLHEGYSLGLYAIHVGDALVTTLLMSLILGAWAARNEKRRSSAAS